jgi:choline dehydrogenase-like flavoprotein
VPNGLSRGYDRAREVSRHARFHAFRAAQQVGIPYSEDFNGARQEGVGFYQTTTSGDRPM